ncbi:hypothetical protein ALQ62_200029 [Pseudomonas coronafaciens pv. zizaniae]|uniref:hypothetical protein n=1 Tax=Pseudomonas coronafaciens TaxID=53409 RepID=UPI0006D62FF2|nr:hypothetical protein [Pseudomonas coronafaciens]KPZ29082.1 hypothetical protein ALO38_101146 [Pseudomonas coronafaciens pv. zizaniae]RMN26305.1 hypothetical protein ALQ62_200029 [Pseudomonas coronafaciens pv. zizaniae]
MEDILQSYLAAAVFVVLLAVSPSVYRCWAEWRRKRFLISQIPEQEKRWHPMTKNADEKDQARANTRRRYPY